MSNNTKDDDGCYIHGPVSFPQSDGCKCEKCVPSSNERLLHKALTELLDRYVGLVNCGDCGNWDPEKEGEVAQARAALRLAKVAPYSKQPSECAHAHAHLVCPDCGVDLVGAIQRSSDETPALRPMPQEQLKALCKRFLCEGYAGDYFENDGEDFAREVERVTIERAQRLPVKPSAPLCETCSQPAYRHPSVSCEVFKPVKASAPQPFCNCGESGNIGECHGPEEAARWGHRCRAYSCKGSHQ